MQYEFSEGEVRCIKKHYINADAQQLPFTVTTNPGWSYFKVRVWGSVPSTTREYETQAPDDVKAMRESVRRFMIQESLY